VAITDCKEENIKSLLFQIDEAKVGLAKIELSKAQIKCDMNDSSNADLRSNEYNDIEKFLLAKKLEVAKLEFLVAVESNDKYRVGIATFNVNCIQHDIDMIAIKESRQCEEQACESINAELKRGDEAGVLLANHLINMGSSKGDLSVNVDGHDFKIVIEQTS